MKRVQFFALFLALFGAFTQTAFAQGLSTQQIGKIVTEYYASVDAGNQAATKATMTDNFTLSVPVSPVPLDQANALGLFQGYKAAFPDMRHELLDWFASGNKVAVSGIFTGTNTGSAMGNPPTGNKVRLPFNTILQLTDKGKISSIDVKFDIKSFEAQMMAGMDPNAKIEAGKKSVLTAYDALNRKDFATFAALCAPNYTEMNVGPAPVKGVQESIELYKTFFDAFPDFKVKVNDVQAVSPTRYLLRVSISGTNTGSFMGMPPTGKPIRFDDADVVELDANGKAISHSITNVGEPLRQIGYGSLLNPNTQVVIAAYEKFGKGDVPGILAMSTDDVTFDIQDRMFDSKPRMFKGKSEVGKFFQELGGKFQYTKFQPTRFVADGDDVFILVDAEYALAATGKKYTSTYTHHFKVVNGKITYFRGVDDFQIGK